MVELKDQIAKLPVPVVIDHMGAPDLSKGGPEQPGFQALIELLKGGNTYVKLCGAYRLDFNGAPWPKADPFARALIEAAPDRCVWGSDWPHPYCVTKLVAAGNQYRIYHMNDAVTGVNICLGDLRVVDHRRTILDRNSQGLTLYGLR